MMSNFSKIKKLLAVGGAGEKNPLRFAHISLAVIVGFIVVFVVVVFYWPALFLWDFDSGTLGDAFGFWNSIFSGLALIGVVISIILQSQELKAQRLELSKTSEALSGQLRQQQKDNFETTFFRLLGILQDVSNTVRAPKRLVDEPNDERKRDVIKQSRGADIFDRTCKYIDRAKAEDLGDGLTVEFTVSTGPTHTPKSFDDRAFFDWIYENFADELGQYYRILFNLLEMIDEADHMPDQKRYANLVRAGLSKSQVILLALNCASAGGSEQMQFLVVKWNILKYLPREYVNRFSLNRFYPNGLGLE